MSQNSPEHSAANAPPELLRRDYLRGMSYQAIAEKYRIDKRTAKRYVDKNLPFAEYEHRPYHSNLDPYKPAIDNWLSREPIFASTIHEWLVSRGYSGSYSIVNRYVQKVILANEARGVYPPHTRKSRQAPEHIIIQEKISEEYTHVRNQYRCDNPSDDNQR